MYSRVLSASLFGLTGDETWVEVDTEKGLPCVTVVGLANQAIKEAKERIHSAMTNCSYDFPNSRITINLTPANRKKEGSHFDLAIAVGVMLSSGQIKVKVNNFENTAFLGELSLDGKINAVDGVLPMIIGLKKRGIERVVLPMENMGEAMLVKGMLLYPASTLAEVGEHIYGKNSINPTEAEGYSVSGNASDTPDFADIRGQAVAKRAAQVAAAGMHGLLMIGPPGVGKSMIGKRIPGIMPPLTYNEQLEITQVYSIAGELNQNKPMITERPFRAPHHSMSSAALVGGGIIPRPGEISLAHTGVLFLDELPEFSSHTLDMLRQPLEDAKVSITRVNGKCVFPARFMLVAAMNPCRCGYYGDPVRKCTCTETDRKHYLGKISGPLLDRIDLNISMERIVYEDVVTFDKRKNTGTEELRRGVIRAIEMQRKRYDGTGIEYNSQLTPVLINRYCRLDEKCNGLMEDAFRKWDLSARSYHRILKLARTIADIDGEISIKEQHILEALSYKMPDKFYN